MARIPTYRRQVRPEVAGAPRVLDASVDTTGLARGVQNVASAIDQVHQQEVRDANQTAMLDADNRLGAWQNQTLYDPEKGMMNRKGSAALGITQSFLGDFDKQQQAISESLANDDQRRMFNQSALSRRQSLQAKLGGYEFDQQQVYKNQVDEASISLAKNSAALNYNDPNAVAESHAKIDAVLQLQAKRNGWAPEALEANRQKVASDMYSDILRRQAAQDPYKAQAALKSYQQYLTADDLTQIGGSIDAKVERLQQRAEMAQLRAEARAERALGKINTQISSGIPATDEMWSAWARQVQGTPAQAEFNELRRQENETQQVLRLPIDQQIAYVNQRSSDLQNNGGTVAEASNLARLGRAVDANGKMMTDAPLEYFQQRLGGDVQPLDFNSDSLPAALSERVAAIQGMRQKFGPTVAMKPLLPQEAKQLSAQLEQMPPDQQSQLFATLHSAMGDDRAYAGAMQQIAPDSPVSAVAGAIYGKQQQIITKENLIDPNEVATSRDIATTLLTGKSILNKTKDAKASDGRGGNFPMPKSSEFDAAISQAVGNAYARNPQAFEIGKQSIRAMYAGLAAQIGDVSGEINPAIMDRAIKSVVGEKTTFNGQDTFAPWGMSAEDFEEKARDALIEIVEEQKLGPISMVDDLTLVPYKNGEYSVLRGNSLQEDANGRQLRITIGGGQ